jgi:hypothetical protein
MIVLILIGSYIYDVQHPLEIPTINFQASESWEPITSLIFIKTHKTGGEMFLIIS